MLSTNEQYVSYRITFDGYIMPPNKDIFYELKYDNIEFEKITMIFNYKSVGYTRCSGIAIIKYDVSKNQNHQAIIKAYCRHDDDVDVTITLC